MARRSSSVSADKAPVFLVFGEEGLLVRQRARAVYDAWCAEVGGMDHERIDGSASHSGEVLRVVSRLREALQTLPFFGTGKVIWVEGCNFLGDDRVSTAKAVTEVLAELADELGKFRWAGVRLVMSAGKVDKRRTFYRTVDRIGQTEEIEGLSANERDWEIRAEAMVRDRAKEAGKGISAAATAALVGAVGANLGQLLSEVDKLSTYVGGRAQIQADDVAAVSVRNKQARAFALGDALGNRDLGQLVRALDEELWEAKADRGAGGEIGVLYGLVSKVRAMLVAKGLLEEGLIRSEGEYFRFKAQLEKLPEDRFGSDRRFNPRLMTPFVLFRAAQQAKNYTREELVQALERLMECGLSLMTSALDEGIILQQALVEICGGGGREGESQGLGGVRSRAETRD